MPRLALLLLCVAAPAYAQVPIDQFRPAVDSRGYLTLNGSQVLDHGDVSFGLGSLAWGRHPDTTIDHVVTATLVGAVGIRIGIPVELGVSVPFTIVKGAMADQGVGSAGLHGKLQLLHAGWFELAAVGSAFMPAHNAMLGMSTRTEQLLIITEARFGRFRIAVNGGMRSDSQLPLGAAVAFALAPERFEIVGEAFQSQRDRGEALGGVKLYLAKNSYLSLGAGRGFVDGTPDLRAFVGIVFEPKPAERRAAVVPDVPPPPAPPPAPEPDRDPAPPDTSPVIDAGSELELLENIEFEFDKAVLRPSAARILDAVVRMMQNNPAIQLVEVQGHTDEQGSAEYNLGLSDRRAAAVLAYLVDHGVAASRLRSHGYGLTRPIDPAHTEVAYARNRRVEFHVIERSDM